MTLDKATARAWLEVDENALISNLDNARSCLSGAEIIAVLKANAYGMGIEETARLLYGQGVGFFAVACLQEALQIKAFVGQSRILIMGNAAAATIPDAIKHGIRMTAASPAAAQVICDCAKSMSMTGFVHFKLDTGMHRIGFYGPDAAKQIQKYAQSDWICAEGLFSHLALRDYDCDHKQYEYFSLISTLLQNEGVVFRYRHLLDSIGMVRYPEWQMDAVRVGAFLYGNCPKRYEHPEKVKPVAALRTRIVRVEEVRKNECIGYDDTHPLEEDCRVATLSVGYADGYSRAVSGIGEVEICGKRARVLGLVCMDQMMVDVTGIPEAFEGGEAILYGGGISIREYAAWGKLNQNECTAVIGRRVPRIYYKDGSVCAIRDEIEDAILREEPRHLMP
jgi:alanine racemase